jgi:RimJ/RimL family protein N-acetyltransferase
MGASVSVPDLETPRLLLRAHGARDFDDLTAMWSDRAVLRHISANPSSPEESWARMLRYAGLWSLLGYGYWAVEERATGRFVGDVGVAEFHRTMTPPLDGPEAGWVLASWAHGRGFATEAATAMLAWCDAHVPAAKTVCIIDPGNLASVRVAHKCGYRPLGERAYKGHPVTVFERPKP